MNRIYAEDLVRRHDIDAHKWAASFIQIFGSDLRRIDEGLMIGWFANAIMTTHDKVSIAKDIEIAKLTKALEDVQQLSSQRSTETNIIVNRALGVKAGG